MEILLQNIPQLIHQCLIDEDYVAAVTLCEDAISLEPDIKINYWYLGLIHLLQGNEIEAQMTWAFGMSDVAPQDELQCVGELASLLELEADRILASTQEEASWQKSLLIRQHLYEIAPEYLSNLLRISQLSLELGHLAEDDEIFSCLIEILHSKEENLDPSDEVYILELLQQILELYPHHPSAPAFAAICVDRLTQQSVEIFEILLSKTIVFMETGLPQLSMKYAKLCYQLQPHNIIVIAGLANLYQEVGQPLESIQFAQKITEISSELVDQIASNYLITRGFMKAGGKWNEAQAAYQVYLQSIQLLIDSEYEIDIKHTLNIASTGMFLLYFQDQPQILHQLLQKVGEFCQLRIRHHFLRELSYVPYSFLKSTNKILKIGYISRCFRSHSVGWISRWLFKYHDPKACQIYAYSLQQATDHLQSFFSKNCYQFWEATSVNAISTIANQIAEDQIDILVDLDGLTSNHISAVMVLKPAPIQVTWLGSDASGLPAIDYFIADPFVLPENAQDYYSAKIWRLPQTYLAVDGFETGLPTLRRSDLHIPEDAIVYLSSQTTPKRHPETVKLQMQILQAVPNSYFLIKGGVNQPSVQEFFAQVAEETGVSKDRLRFLPDVNIEVVHRTNLLIADVVLDTYPYNGATTTLETLWMGIPLVTLVGEQFAARNSYTMLKNVGLTEGIAWTDAEYIEWGVRFGTDANLRSKVSWHLQQSRKTSPLWNGKSFTKEMEKSYQQMWGIYINS